MLKIRYFLVILVIFITSQSFALSFSEGIRLYRGENFEEALIMFQKIYEKGERSTLLEFYMGLSYKQVGDYKNAELHFKKSVTGSPRVADAYVELIDSLISQNKLMDAGYWIDQAKKEKSVPGKIDFQEGTYLFMKGDYENAIKSFESAKVKDSRLEKASDMQIALAYTHSRKFDEASVRLKKIISDNPESEYEVVARNLVDKIEAAKPKTKLVSLSAKLGYFYNDNVPSEPVSGLRDALKSSTGNDPGPTELEEDKIDRGYVSSFSIGLTPEFKGPFYLNAQLGYSGMKYNNDSAYDLKTVSYNLKPGFRKGQYDASLELFQTDVTLDGSSYMKLKGYKPVLTYVLDANQALQFSVGKTFRDMDKDSVDPNEERDGSILSVTAAYFRVVGQKGLTGARLERAFTDTDGDNWDSVSTNVTGFVSLPIVDKLTGSVSLSGSFQTYDNTHTIFDTKRKDDVYTLGGSLKYAFTDFFGVYIEASHTEANSNIALYEYDKDIYGIGLELKY